MPVRKAEAVWHGSFKEGHGHMMFGEGAFEVDYSAGSRFEEESGSNPEELLGASHAGCFSMALSSELGKLGVTAESIRTTAAVSLEKTDAGFTITSVHLDLKAKIPGADKETFEKAANNAKKGCPVSRVLNAEITLDAVLES